MTNPPTPPAWWAWEDGTGRVRVRVVPGARKSVVAGSTGDSLRLRIAAPPVEGKANEEVCRLVAKRMGVRASAVEVVIGLQSRNKSVRVVGVEQSAWTALVPEGEQ